MQKMQGRVISVRPSSTRHGQDRVKVRVGASDENIIDIYSPTGAYDLDDVVKLKVSLDGKRCYRDVPNHTAFP